MRKADLFDRLRRAEGRIAQLEWKEKRASMMHSFPTRAKAFAELERCAKVLKENEKRERDKVEQPLGSEEWRMVREIVAHITAHGYGTNPWDYGQTLPRDEERQT